MVNHHPVLGIDPSLRSTGFAWHFQNGGWLSRLHRGDHISPVRIAIMGASLDGCKVAYIEDGYLGPNPKTAKQLDQLRGQMQAWCIDAGMRYVMVSPSEWQSAMLGKCKKGETKAKSILVAQDLGGDIMVPAGRGGKQLKPDDNLADATNIAEYGRLQEEMER